MSSVPDFRFDRKTQRYRYADSGQFLSEELTRKLLSKKITQTEGELQKLGQSLINGEISLEDWETKSAQTIKNLHVQNYLLGLGGERRMTQRDYGILGNELKFQYERLNNFSEKISETGMSEEQFTYRLGQYAYSGRRSFERAREESHQRESFGWERRLRSKLDSCEPCISYAAAGWVPIGTLPAPTYECDCRANCGCYKQFSQGSKPQDGLIAKWGWLNGDKSLTLNNSFKIYGTGKK